MLDAENLKLFFVQAHAAQHKAVAAQRLDGIDAHAAHHFLNLVLPRGDKIHKALVADVRVKALHKVGALGCDAPVALAGLAASAQMAAERQKCRRADVASICTERDGLDNIGAGANGAADNERNRVADAFIAQALIDRCEGKFNRDADVIADARRRCARAAAEAVDGDDVRAAACNAGRNGCNVVHRRNLDDDGLFVV